MWISAPVKNRALEQSARAFYLCSMAAESHLSEEGTLSPSAFMRELRPEYYSDTQDRVAYSLDRSQLEYHLDSLTSRNQTQDFELFCRKLCERAICPNLRGQTGPDGGGDSKADAETFPVADEISTLFYEGQPNAGKERWAFAFSAKAKWQDKVRSDVKGIIDTGRKYDRIICLTSRFAKSKTRADLEDKLSAQYGVRVTIHDRSWIVDETIDADRKDLAFNYLRVGEAKSDPLRLGPTDYSRLRQLTDIEKSLGDPAGYDGMKHQRVTEALLAAKLSRGLEHPRTEVEGRFMRAVRLADNEGSFQQKLEAQYELIWTAFWWYDDIQLVNGAYEAFEALLGESDHALNVSLLCNLNQLLVNATIHKLLSRSDLKLDERTDRLEARLNAMAADKARPNNSLEAQTSLLTLRINKALLEKPQGDLSPIWQAYGDVIGQASGMGEYDAQRLRMMIEAMADVAGDDAGYTALVEKLSSFIADRTSEAEGALVLLRRAQKLSFDEHFEMIRLLGRAVMGLTKKEHTEELIDAVLALSLAYRSAGLLWAARSACVFGIASVIILGEEEGELPVTIIPALKMLAWITLELRHIPDFLAAIQLLNGAAQSLPLADESKELVSKDLMELGAALGSVLLNLTEGELSQLAELPDILNALGLWMSRSGLLFAMGHGDALRADESIPEGETDEGARELMTMLASQPVGRHGRPLVLNSDEPHTLETSILGMRVVIEIDGSDQQIMIAEIVAGAFEVVFATVPEQRVAPHTEKVTIRIETVESISEPEFYISELTMAATLRWPTDLKPFEFERQGDIQKFLFGVAGEVLGYSCLIEDFEGLLNGLLGDEAIKQRIAIIPASLNSFHRLWNRHATRVSAWEKQIKNRFEVKHPLPKIDRVDLNAHKRTERGAKERPKEPPIVKDHRAMAVRSVIDIHAWDKAIWRGLGFSYPEDVQTPIMGLLFLDEEAARSIFTRWRERFGDRDQDGEIRICLVRHLPGVSPHHYCVIVSGKMPEAFDDPNTEIVVMPNRSLVTEPVDDVNLETFLEGFRRHGSFYLMPAVLGPEGPEFIKGVGITKTELVIREASELTDSDPDSVALHKRERRA